MPNPSVFPLKLRERDPDLLRRWTAARERNALVKLAQVPPDVLATVVEHATNCLSCEVLLIANTLPQRPGVR